jgi:copper transport protein
MVTSTSSAATPTTSEVAATTTVLAAVAAPAAAPPPAPVLENTDDASKVAGIGRLIFFPSAVLAIGVLAFAAFAFVGRREELGTLIRLVRWLGVGVALGALIEVVGLETLFGGFDVVLDETAGRAALARLLGGLMLVVGFVSTRSSGGRSAGGPRSLSAAVAVDETSSSTADPVPQTDSWRPSARDSVGLIGMSLVLLSFAFDGHTLSEGPRLLHAVLSVVHVASAGVWAGGVLALAVVLRRRHNDRVDSRGVEMIVRFSVAAMFSLGLAGLAGVVMALFIDSDVASYLSTDWGRILVVKVVLVGAAAMLGAYNHFRVLPALERTPDNSDVIAQARNTVTTEAIVLFVVALASAILVGASTL